MIPLWRDGVKYTQKSLLSLGRELVICLASDSHMHVSIYCFISKLELQIF